ncbi:Clavaminate synthase-like protein, partial [Lentithecium fluviatile CBS 122367]
SFQPQEPTILKNHLHKIPAILKWFKPSTISDGLHELNSSYLEKYSSTIVPLELRRSDPTAPDGEQRSSFERLEAPLSLLISHMTSSEQTIALYLAQCAIDDLPTSMRADLPTPDLLSHLGRGDIYASSLWMGRPPTKTPLHRDPNPNLFIQLAGRKVARLMEPEHGRQLYERLRAGAGHAHMRGEEMMIGYEMERLEDAVWGDGGGNNQDVRGVEATLESGDALFIPLGWWHAVRGIGQGANASVNWWFR